MKQTFYLVKVGNHYNYKAEKYLKPGDQIIKKSAKPLKKFMAIALGHGEPIFAANFRFTDDQLDNLLQEL